MSSRTTISKTMAYLLRHDPEGMSMDEEGWVLIEELAERLEDRDLHVDTDELRTVVEEDPKGRYEIDEPLIRARYGHSVEADPTLTPAEEQRLYHGTTGEAVEQILKEGLRARGRQKVHLSVTLEEARTVGKRRTSSPVIFVVDARAAQEEGISIERASDVVYVADQIPPRFISRHNN